MIQLIFYAFLLNIVLKVIVEHFRAKANLHYTSKSLSTVPNLKMSERKKKEREKGRERKERAKERER